MIRVLCVDDNDNNLFMLRAILKRAGFEALGAEDAESGIELARREHPDAILMDLMLPGIDGLEATRRLKAAPETRDIPIIILSAHEESEKGAEARAAGCDAYARKPLDVADLITKISRLTATADAADKAVAE
ncbi:MAG: response regulator [Alphaproteobacteria bacterium]|nr:MAG: response regulator [Alphaproteobacteria bacterium]